MGIEATVLREIERTHHLSDNTILAIENKQHPLRFRINKIKARILLYAIPLVFALLPALEYESIQRTQKYNESVITTQKEYWYSLSQERL